MLKKIRAFTLAEMMVVMLILTIVLAAFAPLMTKRKTVDLSSPWRYATNNSDIYYGLGANQTAMIGQNSKATNDPDSRLIIKTNSDAQAYITLKNDEQGVLGGLYWQSADTNGGTLRLGGPYTTVASDGNNTGMGYMALKSLTSGYSDTALGSRALSSNTKGVANTAVGSDALTSNISGNSNTAVGFAALMSNSGSLPLSTSNTAVGANSMQLNTTGYDNTAIGFSSLSNNLTGYGNSAIGYNACKYVTGSNKTCIGANSGPSSTATAAKDTSNVVYLGTANSVVYIPGTLVVGKSAILNSDSADAYTAIQTAGTNYRGGSYKIRSMYNSDGTYETLFVNRTGGNSDVAEDYTNLSPVSSDTINQYSDKRLKNINGENNSGLEQIRELKVFNYTFKKDKEKTPQVGVIAQDLQKVFPNAVKKGEDGYLTIRKDDMFYALINAVKQLDKIVQSLIGELKIIEIKLDTLIKQENLKDKKIKDLEKRIEKLEKHFS